MKRKSSPLFIPLCGLFGLIAGQVLGGGGNMTFLGMGIGMIVGVLMRLYIMNRPN